MTPFSGFSGEIFESVAPSEKIRKPINALKELRLEIEPELRKINPDLVGHVSRTKKKGTNEYNNWAWLYFNTYETEAYRYSQLTVNISPNRLYVGVNVRTYSECLRLKEGIEKTENTLLFEDILRSLSGREWIIPNEDWDQETPRRYLIEELRGIFLYPHLFWINACFEKDEPMVGTRRIADEIVHVFKELYNVYAFASGNQTVEQPGPKHGVFRQETVNELVESIPKSDDSVELETKRFLSSLKTTCESGDFYLPGRKDQYLVRRTALELNLKPHELDFEDRKIIIYSDRDLRSFGGEALKNYPKFVERLNEIKKSLDLPEGFLKVMFVNPRSDVRYYKLGESSSVLLNLARFETNKDLFFWLFSVSRELAYIRARRLGYQFVNQLRDILAVALNRIAVSETAPNDSTIAI